MEPIRIPKFIPEHQHAQDFENPELKQNDDGLLKNNMQQLDGSFGQTPKPAKCGTCRKLGTRICVED